jgi:hypothetical protein
MVNAANYARMQNLKSYKVTSVAISLKGIGSDGAINFLLSSVAYTLVFLI